MSSIWYYLYNFMILPLLFGIFHIGAIFNEKIKNGIKDRKKLFENLIIDLNGIDRKKKMVWFHSSSMGEFEQAKPIIKELRKNEKINIIITFFSPSGYRNSKNFPDADIISYIPFDTPYLSRRFLKLVKPDLAIFMRYELWPNFIWQLGNFNIPIMVVDATMRKDSQRKWLVAHRFHKNLFKKLTRVLTVSHDDMVNFKEYNIPDERLLAVGDTRFDRVWQKSLVARERKLFSEGTLADKKVFVAGSTWESDENLIIPAFLKLMKYDPETVLILVPHEPTLIHLEKIENNFVGKTKTIRFSFMNNYAGERVIIVDSIGILSTLYYYADLAYVGGSFKQGVHNVLEPAVYGIPVIYGPKIHNSQEARVLADIGAGIVVKNKKELYKTLRRITSDDELRKLTGETGEKYINSNTGATEKILTEIEKFI